MMKKETTENIEAQLLLYAENELDPAARAEVEALLAQHPEYRQMLAEYDPDFRLPVPETPAFPNKEALLHRTVLPLWVRRSMSAAAVILLLCLAIPTVYRQLHRPAATTFAKNERTQPQPSPAADTTVMTPEEALPDKSLLPSKPVTAQPQQATATKEMSMPQETQPAETAPLMADAGERTETVTTPPADSVTIVYLYTDNLVKYVSILSEEDAEMEQQAPQSTKGKLLQWAEKVYNRYVPEEQKEELTEKIAIGTETARKIYDKVMPVYNTLLSYLSNE